jgi:hypothetical protein
MCSVKMRVDCSFVDIGGIDGLGCLLPLSTIFQLYVLGWDKHKNVTG